MKRLIEFPLEQGGSIIVEVDEPESEGGMVRAARPGEIAAKASQTFEDVIEHVQPAVSAIIAKLRDLSDTPQEMEIEFALKMHTTAGAVIAAFGAEANFKVKIKWQRG
jgi:hypothetical protein